MNPLKKRRIEIGKSLQQVADEVGVSSRQGVSLWELGIAAPRAGYIAKLAKSLRLPIDEVIQHISDARHQKLIEDVKEPVAA